MFRYFRLTTEFIDIKRRGFELADPTILEPAGANPLLEGEFLELDANYKMVRNTGDGLLPAFACVSESGRYETQAIQKSAFLFLGAYEAETKVFDASLEATITTAGQALMVNDVTIGALTRRGLTALPGSPAGTEFTIGYVTKLPANNNGWLRFARHR